MADSTNDICHPAPDTMKYRQPQEKNTRDVLPICREKFGRVARNHI